MEENKTLNIELNTEKTEADPGQAEAEAFAQAVQGGSKKPKKSWKTPGRS